MNQQLSRLGISMGRSALGDIFHFAQMLKLAPTVVEWMVKLKLHKT